MNLNALSDKAILLEIGRRFQRWRLNANKSQTELAKYSGVSRTMVERLEKGKGSTLTGLIRLLRGLNILGQLDVFLPDPGVSPLQLLKFAGKERKRARKNPEREPE